MQLMCCGVESNGWHVYRGSNWFQQFGARDEESITYEGIIAVILPGLQNTLEQPCIVIVPE